MTRFLTGLAALALIAGAASGQELKFAPDQDARFNWASFSEFSDRYNLDGQSLTIFGPWRGEDQVLVESVLAYFTEATGSR